MSNEDDLLAQYIALYAKASMCNVAELHQSDTYVMGRERGRAPALNAPTVPWVRRNVHWLYREMEKNYFCQLFRMWYPALCRLLLLIELALEREID